ncbi:hypothetical protein GCM10027290_11110 [Micromonospora sonneratiae]|uniref:Monosaccharide ABC transporter membrane protein, CUT2 family n=1 Tax=Micromonospora sonneratiae TaxID=1184706 RepID=A0ABW3YI51_9ACTN
MTVLAPPATTPPAPRPRRVADLATRLGWEAVLFLFTVVAAVIVLVQSDGRGLGLPFWLNFAATGLLASGFALSLRTATPNLAVGSLAMLSGLLYADLRADDWPGFVAAAIGVAAVTVLGLILGVVTGLTSTPSWAVSLAGLAVLQAIAFGVYGPPGVLTQAGRSETWEAVVWSTVFVLGSLVGAALFLIAPVRRFLSANRTSGDPASWRPARLVGAIVGFGGSSLLAGLSGVVLTGYLRVALPTGDLHRTLTAVAIALLAGVSIFGRRGGVAGIVLATSLVLLVMHYLRLEGAASWSDALVLGLAILGGAVVSWALEKIGGPEPVQEPISS